VFLRSVIGTLKVQQGIAAKRVQTLQQATANSRLLFKNGMANYLEVITAQSNVLQSELELASIKRSELSAVSELYRALTVAWFLVYKGIDVYRISNCQ
jgi:outer membrane protein TolC